MSKELQEFKNLSEKIINKINEVHNENTAEIKKLEAQIHDVYTIVNLLLTHLDQGKALVDEKQTEKKKSSRTSTSGTSKGKSKKNTSGVKGVSFNNYLNKWHAYINIDGIRVNLGCFENLEDAKQARIIKVNEAFGAFTNKIEKMNKLLLI